MKRWEIIKEIDDYWIVERGKILPPWAFETGEAVGPYETVEKAQKDIPRVMLENCKPWPAPVLAIDRLAEALREELREYGYLLELLRTREQMICAADLLGLSENSGDVGEQMRSISRFRQQREYLRAETLCWLDADADLSWAQMVGQLPKKNQLPLQELLDEINLSLESIHVLLRQNQQLNLRALTILS